MRPFWVWVIAFGSFMFGFILCALLTATEDDYED